MTQKLFSELGLSPEVLKAVERMGFEQASPIQAEAIPPLLAGNDVIGQSQTGSGKTAAFGIPAVELADPANRAVQVLMMCPTRELASQVAEEIAKLAHEGPTDDEQISRITLTVDGALHPIDQVTKQLHKQRGTLWERIRWRVGFFLVNSLDFTVTRNLARRER